jgi:flagellar hook-basal body complex protein FliE
MEIPIIPSLSSSNNPLPLTPPGGETGRIGKGFQDILESLNQSQATSDELIKKLAAGEDVDVHQVMIAFEETDTNFRVAMAIRDRLVDAYKDLKAIQV